MQLRANAANQSICIPNSATCTVLRCNSSMMQLPHSDSIKANHHSNSLAHAHAKHQVAKLRSWQRLGQRIRQVLFAGNA
jgi:hypothetical protein